jgi:DNA-binding response OmpR family regulator
MPNRGFHVGRILVIEDDLTVQRVLQHTFETAGYVVDLCGGPGTMQATLKSSIPTAVVLDLCLPLRSGKEICQELKTKYASLPVVILSAVTDVSDKVLLLELGADDYVTKPFSPRELLARVEAAIRRSNRPAGKDVFAFGDTQINFTAMTVSRNSGAVQLTPQEFKLLKFLVDNQDRVLSRNELLDAVWGYNEYPETRTVDNHVLRLRHKLEKDPTEPLHFRTVHSVGYKFVP